MIFSSFLMNCLYSANMNEECIATLPPGTPSGVYWGRASIDGGRDHGVVLSIGQNIHFAQEKKTLVSEILQTLFFLPFQLLASTYDKIHHRIQGMNSRSVLSNFLP